MSETIRAVRQKYPDAYNDLSDDELTLAIGDKYPVYLSQDETFEDTYNSLKADRNEDSGFLTALETHGCVDQTKLPLQMF